MKVPTPPLPPQSGGQPVHFAQHDSVPIPPSAPGKSLTYLWKYWWVPPLTIFLGLSAAATFILVQPPTYLSKASLFETAKLRLPENYQASEDSGNSTVAHASLLQSRALTEQSLLRLKSASPKVVIPLGKDGEPPPVVVHVSETHGSAVVTIAATGSDAAYIQVYLDSLLNTYLDYRRNIRKVVSGETLASITEQVQRAERDVEAERKTLQAFTQTNNLEVIEARKAVALECLKRLNTQLSDLQVEASHQKSPARSQVDSSPSLTVPLQEDSIRKAIKEWEAKIIEASALTGEVERLKLNVTRSQSLYDRLVTLLQNVAIERNISQDTFSILEPASAAQRTFAGAKRNLAWGGVGGLGLGLVIVGWLALGRARRR